MYILCYTLRIWLFSQITAELYTVPTLIELHLSICISVINHIDNE